MKIFGKFSRTQDVLQKSLLIAEKMGQNFSLIVLFAFLRGGGWSRSPSFRGGRGTPIFQHFRSQRRKSTPLALFTRIFEGAIVAYAPSELQLWGDIQIKTETRGTGTAGQRGRLSPCHLLRGGSGGNKCPLLHGKILEKGGFRGAKGAAKKFWALLWELLENLLIKMHFKTSFKKAIWVFEENRSKFPPLSENLFKGERSPKYPPN